MHFPTWVDLKGLDSVPETVHHVVYHVDPVADTSWHSLGRRVQVSPSLAEELCVHVCSLVTVD